MDTKRTDEVKASILIHGRVPLNFLLPWTEIVGIIEEIKGESIRLRATRAIHVAREELDRWAAKLQKGSRIGILVLDNGSIRIRSLGAGNDDGASRS